MSDDKMIPPAEAPTVPGSEPVTFVVACLVAWDGDPETDGVEHYAPKGWKADPELHAGLKIHGDRFVTTRDAANALAAAGCGTIVS